MASNSSDDDCGFDFAELRKKKKKFAASRLATSPKKHKKIEVSEPVIEDVGILVEDDKPEDGLKILLEKAKAGKLPDKPIELEDDFEPIVEEPPYKRPKRKAAQRSRVSESKDDDDLCERIDRLQAEVSKRRAAEQKADQKLMEEMMLEEVVEIRPHVNIVLRIKFDDDFIRVFNVDYEEQFSEKVFLKYSLEAGFMDPESFSVLWEHDDQIEVIKFYETPKSKNMPTKDPVMLYYFPNEGTVREIRKEGDLKLKFNIKGEEKPMEKYVHKNKTFREVAKELMKELQLRGKQKIRFNFDCDRIQDDDTPESLDMEDLDLIDVIID